MKIQGQQTCGNTDVGSAGFLWRSLLSVALIAVALAFTTGCSSQKTVAANAVSNAATKTTFIPVEGMSCGSCAATVKRGVRKLDGVTDVEVSLEHRGARVRYSEGKVTPDQIAAAITRLGYKAGHPTPEPQ
jgi:copper chaperone CopZ